MGSQSSGFTLFPCKLKALDNYDLYCFSTLRMKCANTQSSIMESTVNWIGWKTSALEILLNLKSV